MTDATKRPTGDMLARHLLLHRRWHRDGDLLRCQCGGIIADLTKSGEHIDTDAAHARHQAKRVLFEVRKQLPHTPDGSRLSTAQTLVLLAMLDKKEDR